MKEMFERFLEIYQNMPPGRRVALALVAAGVVAAIIAMTFWAGAPEHQVLFSNLSQEDAGQIVSKLQEQRIPYQLAQGGTAIMIPGEMVYETRLALATEGLPKGSGVGFEIFDETSFSTTEFVQKLNYQRAIQGELSRTISQFNEVRGAKVLIVPAKDTVFVETTRPATASVLLELASPLSPGKVNGIVHLVANAVEGLAADQVTVVDTTGKVWFKGAGEGDEEALMAGSRVDLQQQTEERLAKHIQSMLEQIVGAGKAVVRVRAEMDFDREEYSEETFDPDAVVVRSQQKRNETSVKEIPSSTTTTTMSGPGAAPASSAGQSRVQKVDEVTNNEINRVERRVVKMTPTITRLSVAAVLDGTYKQVKAEDGTTTSQYVPRTAEELRGFEAIVKKAMGYSEDREDQVTVTSFQFSETPGMDMAAAATPNPWLEMLDRYGKWGLVLVLMLLSFVFVVRPVLKSVKQPEPEPAETQAALPSEEMALLPDAEPQIDINEKARQLANQRFDRAEQLVKGWLGEA